MNPSRSNDMIGALEALLFACPGPLTASEASSLLGLEESEVDRLAEELGREYDGPGRGVELRRVAGGYQVFTRPQYASVVEALVEPERIRLSQAALETLALVAYRQPVTRAMVEEIRGVSSAGVLKTLESAGLIRAGGRMQAPGRPIVYVTTPRFLSFLGIKNLEDLPPLPDGENPGQHSREPAEGG